METKTSFWQLLKKYRIEIPKIQRNYAQGRKDKKTEQIANNFLANIKTALYADGVLSLDFIYGKVIEDTLIPIDGQQRLTTMFLLHWYFAIKESKLTDEIKEILRKFSYETRLSSIDFCEHLVEDNNIELFHKDNKPISEYIKNSSWYFLSWQNDPTVASMLNMLDKIHKEFFDSTEGIFEKLTADTSLPISFYFLPMENFKLSDELYIKMNARGKMLSDFENFKTLFSDYLQDITDRSKLDNEWLDIFWNLEKQKAKESGIPIDVKNVDDSFFYFFTNMTLNFYAENNEVFKSDIDNDMFLFTECKKTYDNTDCAGKIKIVLNALISYSDDEKIFQNILIPHPSYAQRLHFYALGLYFIYDAEHTNTNTKVHSRWMRISKNLINNSIIDGPEDYRNAVLSLKELSSHIKDIYEYISYTYEKIKFFSRIQLKEEAVKAQLILSDQDWLVHLVVAENNSYFDGQVSFILDYSKKDGVYNKELFDKYTKKLCHLFGDDFKENHKFLFQRALLTKGNYLIDVGWNRSFCTFNEGVREKGENWRRVFNDEKRTAYLKALLDDIAKEDIYSELKRIVAESSVTDWRKIIINNSEHIEYCKNRQIRFGEKNAIYLISKTRMSSKHAELHSYTLYKGTFEKNTYEPFSETSYYESNSYKEPCIAIDSFLYKDYHFYIDIRYENGKYIFYFNELNGKKSFPESVTKLLTSFGFIKHRKTGYILSDISESDACDKIKEITSALQKI